MFRYKFSALIGALCVGLLFSVANSGVAQEQANKEANEEFVEAFKAQEGVIERRSGLLIKVIEPGTGALAGSSDTVLVHYEGKLADGTVFDSSYDREAPFRVPVNRVIDGWQEALMLMGEGAVWEFVVPSEIAYGEEGVPGTIPPNSALHFRVELLQVVR